jgi:hypothetical protein
MRHPDDGLIEEYLDGELPAEARGEFDVHAAGCDACRERIEAARAARTEADGLVALLGEPEPRPGAGDLPASLRPPVRRPIRWRNFAWAASLVAAAGLGYFGGTTTGGPDGAADRRAVGRLDSRAGAEAPVGRSMDEPAGRRTDRPTDQPSDVTAGPAATPPSYRLEEVAPPAKQRVDGELARPVAPVEEVRGADAAEAAVAAGRARPAVQPSSPPAASLDDAVRALGGSIRLVDGLEVQRVDVAWLPMPGGDSAAVVELTYADAVGHAIVLRQSRTPTVADAFASADRLERRDAAAPPPAPALGAAKAARENERAAVAQAAPGARDGELSWIDAGGFRLVLRADADADSLARLRARVK